MLPIISDLISSYIHDKYLTKQNNEQPKIVLEIDVIDKKNNKNFI